MPHLDHSPRRPTRIRITPLPRQRRIVPPRPAPAPLTTLIGRKNDVASITALLQHDAVRLVTLTGAGGVGKTRLALAVVTTLATTNAAADGIAYVDLVPETDPRHVVAAIATAVGLRELGDQPLPDQLRDALRDEHLLLVLDNFEHVVEAAPQVAALLSACPLITALVTSRELLRIAGEHAFPVQPLPVPEPGQPYKLEHLVQIEAVQLFAARAQAIEPGFRLTEATGPVVADVCRRLEGLPLAIELAAARLNHLAMPDILARLERRLPLLTGGGRDRPPRHQTIRAAIAWSHDLLDPDEQTLFRRLAVFVAGFTLDAAEWVTGNGERVTDTHRRRPEGTRPVTRHPSPSVLDGIASLVDKSLVRNEPRADGTARFGMLETIREFALEELAARPDEMMAMRRAHAKYFVTLAEAHEQGAWVPAPESMLDRLDAEHANLRAALTWLADTGESELLQRLAGALRWYWFFRGHVREGRMWLECALADGEPSPPAARAKALLALGYVLMYLGESAQAVQVYTEGLALMCLLDDIPGTVRTLIGLGAVANFGGEYERAAELLEEALSLAPAIDDRRIANSLTDITLANLGITAHGQGDLALATARQEEVLALRRAADQTDGVMRVLSDLGDVERDRGHQAKALGHYHEALAIAQDLADVRAIIGIIDGIASVIVPAGEAVRAVRLFSAAEALRQASGFMILLPVEQRTIDRGLAAAGAALSEAELDAAWAAGQELTLEQAIAEARRRFAPPAEVSFPGLTRRENVILSGLVAGKTNREIAAELFISHRTVGDHVSSLLAKLGVRTRSEAAALVAPDRAADDPTPCLEPQHATPPNTP